MGGHLKRWHPAQNSETYVFKKKKKESSQEHSRDEKQDISNIFLYAMLSDKPD